MNKNPALKWIIALSIMVVLNLLFNYSLSLIFDEPQYDEYFPRVTEKYQTQEVCEADGHEWTEYSEIDRPQLKSEGYCDTYTKNQEAWENVREDFEKKVFISLVTLGVITVIISVVITNPVVSLGLGLGAFLNFVIASMRYWRYSEDYLRIIILVVALAVLIWLAVKKFGDRE